MECLKSNKKKFLLFYPSGGGIQILDFKLWKIALLLKIHGYYYHRPWGRIILFLDIYEILNKRYIINSASDINKIITNTFERSQVIFEKDPPFNVKANIPHVDNIRNFRLANKSKYPKTVYIYTNEGMVKGSPFASFSLAHNAVGFKI